MTDTDTVTPTVHAAADAPPLTLREIQRYRQWEPADPYLIDAPGRGIVRLTRVIIDDYRGAAYGSSLDRVRVGYVLHPQTKGLRDHQGRRAEWLEFHLTGQRHLSLARVQDRIEEAVGVVLAARDAAAAAKAAAEQAAADQRFALTARAARLGVDLAWTKDGRPVLSPDLLAVFLTVAEEAQR